VTAASGPPADAQVVDSRGRLCPLPVIDLAKSIVTTDVGACVAVLADDAAAAADIPAWCQLRGHEFVGAWPHEDGSATYVVRKSHDD
jgi:TusA-related sulfurtransferase